MLQIKSGDLGYRLALGLVENNCSLNSSLALNCKATKRTLLDIF